MCELQVYLQGSHVGRRETGMCYEQPIGYTPKAKEKEQANSRMTTNTTHSQLSGNGASQNLLKSDFSHGKPSKDWHAQGDRSQGLIPGTIRFVCTIHLCQKIQLQVKQKFGHCHRDVCDVSHKFKVPSSCLRGGCPHMHTVPPALARQVEIKSISATCPGMCSKKPQ